MVPQPEQHARKTIDTLLAQAGWVVCDADKANIHGARGVAIREFPLKPGHGFADYLLYVDGKAAGVIEAKVKAGYSVQIQERDSRNKRGKQPDRDLGQLFGCSLIGVLRKCLQ